MGMKKLICLILILFIQISVSAQEEVILDVHYPEMYRFNTGTLDYGNQERDKENDIEDYSYMKPSESFYAIKEMFKEDFCNPQKSGN